VVIKNFSDFIQFSAKKIRFSWNSILFLWFLSKSSILSQSRQYFWRQYFKS
jgi:hypothetical protein